MSKYSGTPDPLEPSVTEVVLGAIFIVAFVGGIACTLWWLI
jgi:hypothetical protein